MMLRAVLLALFCLPMAGWGECVADPVGPEPAGTVLYSGPGIQVPSDFGGFHHTGMVVNWAGSSYCYGPDLNFSARMNAVRLYGMNGLEWGNSTEKTQGQYDWTYWDQAFTIFRRVGIKNVIYNCYNPPPFYCNYPHSYGGWRMQLPNNRTAFENWLTAITTRYPEIKTIEVANEVFAPEINSGFWIGTVSELSTLANYVLDWRTKKSWTGKVWAPSIPGFEGNLANYLNWLQNYPRVQEFDAIPAHFYFLTAEYLGLPASDQTSWTCFVELRNGLASRGINKPIVDGEKGFGPGSADSVSIYNYGVKALIVGIKQVCFFQWGSYGDDETNLGRPYENLKSKRAFEKICALGGKTITKVVKPNSGGQYWVQTCTNQTAVEAGLAVKAPLLSAFPNPFRQTVSLRFSGAAGASVDIFNIRGERVARLAPASGQGSAAATEYAWHAGDRESGVFFARVSAGQQVLTRKITLIK